MAFVDWHDTAPVIETKLEIWQQDKTSANLAALEKEISKSLDVSTVKKKKNMLITTNEKGEAFSAMSQADMGLTLIKVGRSTGISKYLNQGIACLNTIITPVSQGGLRRRKNGTSFFHASTDRTRESPGGTLNKHLTATRDLITAGNILDNLGMYSKAKDFRTAGIEGITQLVGSDYPTLEDYLVIYKGQPYPKSWIYYAISIEKKKPYHLEHGFKNAGYHTLVLLMIKAIHEKLGSDFPLSKFQNQKVSGKSVVRFMYDTYITKEQSGISKDEDVKKGNFGGFEEGRGNRLSDEEKTYFTTYYQ